jgi:hypothetical protein
LKFKDAWSVPLGVKRHPAWPGMSEFM